MKLQKNSGASASYKPILFTFEH